MNAGMPAAGQDGGGGNTSQATQRPGGAGGKGAEVNNSGRLSECLTKNKKRRLYWLRLYLL